MANFDDKEIIAMLAEMRQNPSSPNGCLSEGLELYKRLSRQSKNSFTLI